MAELADAHGSGPCGSNTMRVQVPFPAYLFMVFKESDESTGFIAFFCSVLMQRVSTSVYRFLDSKKTRKHHFSVLPS